MHTNGNFLFHSGESAAAYSSTYSLSIGQGLCDADAALGVEEA